MLKIFRRGTTKICRACQKRITSRSHVVPCCGTYYHRDCLRCADCSRPASHQYVSRKTIDAPILLCKDDYLRRIYGPDADDSELARRFHSNDTCGGCRRPIMTGVPMEVDPLGNGHVDGWHQYCWRIYKIWKIKLEDFHPPKLSLFDIETFDAECVLWEDRVQTAFGSITEFGKVLEQRRLMLVRSLMDGRRADILRVARELWDQVDLLMNIDHASTQELQDHFQSLRKAVNKCITRLQLKPQNALQLRQITEETIDMLDNSTDMVQSLLLVALIWSIKQNLHTGEIEAHLHRLELLMRTVPRPPDTRTRLPALQYQSAPTSSHDSLHEEEHSQNTLDWAHNIERVVDAYGEFESSTTPLLPRLSPPIQPTAKTTMKTEPTTMLVKSRHDNGSAVVLTEMASLSK
ncbi:hypothetical protein DFS34DRAFT_285321 [Phlyctochytrium arcticum]|nr:hypothetical protein DFS34DRAFT_285321 [Phlyctochytrium arcticum]